MNSKAMFTAGAAMLAAGVFVAGMGVGSAAEAASYRTTAITYLAPLGNGFDGCGFQVSGTGGATQGVRSIKNYKGDEGLVICQMVVRVPR